MNVNTILVNVPTVNASTLMEVTCAHAMKVTSQIQTTKMNVLVSRIFYDL